MSLEEELDKIKNKISSELIFFKDLKKQLMELETKLVGLKEEKANLEEKIRLDMLRKGK